jgi:hypothetical protein
MTYAQRLRSVRLDPSGTRPERLRNYVDRQALADQFGPDARDRYLEDTKGLGHAIPTGDHLTARHWKTKEPMVVPDNVADYVYLGGDRVE